MDVVIKQHEASLLHSVRINSNLNDLLLTEQRKRHEMERIHHARDKSNAAKAELLTQVMQEVSGLKENNESVKVWLTQCDAPIEIICQTLRVMGADAPQCDGYTND